MTFLYSHWLQLPLSTRQTIAEAFGIPRSHSIEVSDNRVVKDGYTVQDVEVKLTLEKLQAYTGSETADMPTLWELMVCKAEGREMPTVVEEEPKEEVARHGVVMADVVTPEAPKKGRGRPKKNKYA